MTSFSIITVTRNNNAGLHRTARSIANQTHKDYEWIIIDGDSQDSTKDYLKAQKMTQKWVSEPDAGLYDAMNKGLDLAENDYIIFMNSGDCFAHIKTLEHVTKPAVSQPALIYGDSFELENNNKLYPKRAKHINYKDALMTHHQSIYYNRRKIGSLRYNTAYKIAADYDFTQRFLKKTHDSAYIASPLCIFEIGGVSMINHRHGRQETYKIRHNLKLVSPFHNKLIHGKQIIASFLRQYWPFFYRLLRRF